MIYFSDFNQFRFSEIENSHAEKIRGKFVPEFTLGIAVVPYDISLVY